MVVERVRRVAVIRESAMDYRNITLYVRESCYDSAMLTVVHSETEDVPWPVAQAGLDGHLALVGIVVIVQGEPWAQVGMPAIFFPVNSVNQRSPADPTVIP